MADNIKGTPRSGGAPTYVQEEAAATPAVTNPTDVHEALTASTGANATSIGNLDAKNRRMYKHIPAEQRRDWLEDEAERDRVEANQDAVIEDHVKRLPHGFNWDIDEEHYGTAYAVSYNHGDKYTEHYGHINGVLTYPTKGKDGKLHNKPSFGVGRIKYTTKNGETKNIDGIIFPTIANDITLGMIRPGDGVSVAPIGDPETVGRLSINPATASTIGGVKVGDNISVAADGTISTDVNKAYVDAADKKNAGAIAAETKARTDADTALEKKISDAGYTLPVASSTTLGGVKVGDNIALAEDGTISADINVLKVNTPSIDKSGAKVSSNYSIALGDNARVTSSDRSIAIGYASSVNGYSSIALGYGSTSGRQFELSLGTSYPGQEISRFISNVKDPEKDSDAATKHYVDTKVASGAYTLHAATDSTLGGVKASASISIADDGTAKVNPSIFSDGLTATDAQVSVDTGFVGEHLAGDALYYDSTKGLNLKVGTGLEIQNDAVSVDTDALPLASASTRGTVKVGSGLAIAADGTLSATGGASDSTFKNYRITASGEGIAAAVFTSCWGTGYVKDNTLYVTDTLYVQFRTSAAFTAGTTISLDIAIASGDTYATSVVLNTAHPRYYVSNNAGIGNGFVTIDIGTNNRITLPVTSDIPALTDIVVELF